MKLRGNEGVLSKAGFVYEHVPGGYIVRESKVGRTIGKVAKVSSQRWYIYLPGGIVGKGNSRDEAVQNGLKKAEGGGGRETI